MAAASTPTVTMEITDEMLKSMEVGLAFRDYLKYRALVTSETISCIFQGSHCKGGLQFRTMIRIWFLQLHMVVTYGMFDARKFEMGPFDIFSVGNDDSEVHVIKFSSDGRRLLLTTKAGRVHVLDSFHGNNIATYNVKPVITNSTLEATFSPDGNYIWLW
ncbi:protein ANTHESIS POMOTING FACTOR 1-like isoform X1 [Phragmites australis]|uniref:protein ANTHESIS POMOTING FACTOR 1-like isoform X1 n=1 Tax=Phragmites australis TaxID=29695 RepID=UPI002D79B099|nr:protein ANTHESIS POMOTING FACTOR 1-like isoform X1 [Phragmites australis]